MLKKIWILVFLISTKIAVSQTNQIDASRKLVYFTNDFTFNIFKNNNTLTPRPNIPIDSFQSVLLQHAIYPELAKKNFLSAKVQLQTTFDEDGKITGINLISIPNQLFDTAAIKLILSTKNLWTPCTYLNNRKRITLGIVVYFEIEYSFGKINYTIRPFFSAFNLKVGTSDNHPALLITFNKNSYNNTFINKMQFDASEISKFHSDYGTVTVGFDIDTVGGVSDIVINNSVDQKLDSIAIEYIKSTNNKWIPAVMNGIKKPSHKEFDMMYYQIKEIGYPNYYQVNNYTFTPTESTDKIDFDLAIKAFEVQHYKKALSKLDLVCNYLLRNPIPYYYRGLTHLNLGNAEKGCEDIKYAQVLAEQYGYPLIMEKDKVMDFLRKSCGEE